MHFIMYYNLYILFFYYTTVRINCQIKNCRDSKTVVPFANSLFFREFLYTRVQGNTCDFIILN